MKQNPGPRMAMCLLLASLLPACGEPAVSKVTDTALVNADTEPHTESDTESDTDTDSDPSGRLPQGIHAIDGLEADLPYGDLAPFGEMIGNANVVALGESVHTCGGFYQAKYRLFKYLVEERGFRAFAFESPWTDADMVAEYIESDCTGGAVGPVTQGLFTVWASTYTADLVEWMCQFNQVHPDDRLGFFGFDIQQPWDDGPFLISFLGNISGVVAEPINAGLIRCNGAAFESVYAYYNDPDAMEIDEDDHAACISALDATQSYLEANASSIIAVTSAEQFEWAKIALVGLRSWELQCYLLESDAEASYTARDEGMAYAFQKIKELRYPDARVALWAHNWHISLNATKLLDEAEVVTPNLGKFLAEDLGSDYYPVGLIGFEVHYDWPGIGAGTLYTASRSVAAMLHHLGEEYLLVDLSFPGADDPLLTPGEAYRIDSIISTAVPADLYRALFFLDYAEPMELLSAEEK